MNAISQVELTGCASLAYDAADVELNLTWKDATDAARRMDTTLRAGEVPALTILRDAQRSWITFRDQACEAESLVARGGTMQNQLFYECLTRLTRTRVDDLRLFAGVN